MSLHSTSHAAALYPTSRYGSSLILFSLINLTGCIVDHEGYQTGELNAGEEVQPIVREADPVDPNLNVCEDDSCGDPIEPECTPGDYEYTDDLDCYCLEEGRWECYYYEPECYPGEQYQDECESCDCVQGYFDCYYSDQPECYGPIPPEPESLPEPEPAVSIHQGFCGDWAESSFDFPRDELACDGAQQVRFDETQQLWVGVVSCEDDTFNQVRLYLSSNGSEFFPATDTAGHGQDHCELISDTFGSLRLDDDITSGGCEACSTSQNISIEYLPVFNRSGSGERFVFERSDEWSWQTSRLTCGRMFCDAQ